MSARRDHLNARERVGLLLIDEQPDRVPAFPLITNHAAALVGISLTEYCTDGKALGRAHVAAFEEYGHDILSVFTVVAMVAEAMGSELLYRDGHLPVLRRPAVKTNDDLADLRVPDPYRDGNMPAVLEATEYCFSRLGHLVPVGVFVAAPFSTAVLLRGIEAFMQDLLEAPAQAHALLKAAAEATMPFLEAVMTEGGLPVLVDPLASGSLISPAMYRVYAVPYEKQLVDFLHRYDMDVILHICGDMSRSMHLVPLTGADLVSLDKVDLATAKASIGDKVRLIGNVDPSDVMLRGAPKEVRCAVRACLDAAKDNPKGFIAATGCEIPFDTPPENVKAFVEAVRSYGRYW